MQPTVRIDGLRSVYNDGMNDAELLKQARNGLLSLHKSLVDLERARYEHANGPVTSGQFLNILLEDPNFSWLRQFSTLIVDIDEMFAQKDGYSDEAVSGHLQKLKELVGRSGFDGDFRQRFESAINDDAQVAAKEGELRRLLDEQ